MPRRAASSTRADPKMMEFRMQHWKDENHEDDRAQIGKNGRNEEGNAE